MELDKLETFAHINSTDLDGIILKITATQVSSTCIFILQMQLLRS